MKKLLIILVVLLTVIGASAQQLSEIFKEIPLNGKLITAHDTITIGDNFQQLTNMRYRNTNPIAVLGMSAINTAVTNFPNFSNGFHFIKQQPAESHVLVQARDSSDLNPTLIYNDTAIPSTGNFTGGATATALYTENTSAGMLRFANAPNGHMVACDGVECLIWGGDKSYVNAFIASTSTITNLKPTNPSEYTEFVTNTLTSADQTVNIGKGNDADIIALWQFEGSDGNQTATQCGLDIGDATTYASHNLTVNTADEHCEADAKKYGYTSLYLDGTGDYAYTADHADFDYNSGTDLTIEMWIRPNGTITSAYLYHQWNTNYAAGDFDEEAYLWIDASGFLEFVLENSTGAVQVQLTDDAAVVTATWYHVVVTRDNTDDTWKLFVNGTLEASEVDATDWYQAKFDSPVNIGRNGKGTTNYFTGYIDQVRLAATDVWDSAFNTLNKAYSPSAYNLLVGFTRPIQGIYFDVDVANTQPSTMAIKHWTGGGWVSVASLVDSTSASSATLGQDGWVTFTSTTSTSEPVTIQGYQEFYWYNIAITDSGDGDASGSLISVTVDAPVQTVKNVWDGVYREPVSFRRVSSATGDTIDYLSQVLKSDWDSSIDSTHIAMSAWSQTLDFEAGFEERLSGIEFDIENEAQTGTVLTVIYYWDGSQWVPVTNFTDGTLDAAADSTFATKGIMSWSPPEDEVQIIKENGASLYYYKIDTTGNNFSATATDLDAIRGIPASESIKSYKFPIFSKNRIMLASRQDQDKNSLLIGNESTVDVFNGDDSTELFFGDERELTAGIGLFSRLGSNIYDITLLYKSESMYGLSGFDPEDFQIYTISETIGCVAPLTLQSTVIDIEGQGSKPVVIWQASDGIYLFDNTSPVKISRDIDNLFDPNESSTRHIKTSCLDDSTAFVDRNRNEYHFLYADGGATNCVLNREAVFDLKRFKWFEIDRGVGDTGADKDDLQAGFSVQDTNGNYYNYGLTDEGDMQRLENGTTFDGDDMTFTMWTGAFAPYNGSVMYTTQQTRHKVIMTAKETTANSLAITHYCDTASSGTSLTAVSPSNSGYTIADVLQDGKISSTYCIFHSYKYVMTTNDETFGFEPIFIGTKFDIINEDKTVTR